MIRMRKRGLENKKEGENKMSLKIMGQIKEFMDMEIIYHEVVTTLQRMPVLENTLVPG